MGRRRKIIFGRWSICSPFGIVVVVATPDTLQLPKQKHALACGRCMNTIFSGDQRVPLDAQCIRQRRGASAAMSQHPLPESPMSASQNPGTPLYTPAAFDAMSISTISTLSAGTSPTGKSGAASSAERARAPHQEAWPSRSSAPSASSGSHCLLRRM